MEPRPTVVGPLSAGLTPASTCRGLSFRTHHAFLGYLQRQRKENTVYLATSLSLAASNREG
eukprot:365702-Chlamydomonas_euryale.AAC.24